MDRFGYSTKKNKFMKRNVLALLIIFSVGVVQYSCSDPSQSAAEESATQTNDTDSSSSNTDFGRDTTVDMNAGAGVGLPVGEGDSLEKSGKSSGQ